MNEQTTSITARKSDDVLPTSAVIHAIHNLKQYRADPRNNMFPGEAVGMLDDFVRHTLNMAQEAAPMQLPIPVSSEELAALRRFYECAVDGEGYDVPKEMMRRLAELGLVNRKSGAYFETTSFGLAVLEGKFAAPAGSVESSPHIEDPAPYDRWMHDMLFSDPPKSASAFDAWKAGRQLERQRAAAGAVGPAAAPSQRALFDQWWQNGNEQSSNDKQAMLRTWYAALDAQQGAQFDVDQEHRFNSWYSAGAATTRLTAARAKLRAIADSPEVTGQALYESFLEFSKAMPQDSKDSRFNVWEAALAANR